MAQAAKTAGFLTDYMVNTAMLGRHRLSFRCMKRSRVDPDGAISRCTSPFSIVGGSLDMRGVMMPNVVPVAESIANDAQMKYQTQW